MNKNIGILTFHYSLNEGAILQAFCLARHLRSTLGELYNAELIDFRYPRKTERAYGKRAQTKRGAALNRFIDGSLLLSKKKWVLSRHSRVAKYINDNYNALVVGSDEVWKVKYDYYWKLFYRQNDDFCVPFPNIYWPGPEIKIPRVSYAASVGPVDPASIPYSHRLSMRRRLSGFSLLGVRDNRTLRFLEWLDPSLLSKAELVPDPVFTMDMTGLDTDRGLDAKLKNSGVDMSRPKALILARATKNIVNAIDHFKSIGFQTLSMGVFNKYADVDLSGEGFDPLEWLSIFGKADIVISSRMHGCAASVLNNVPFIGINQNYDFRDNKIEDVMRSCGLENFYFDEKNGNQTFFMDMCKKLSKADWPFDAVNGVKDKFKKRSSDFALKISEIAGKRKPA